MIKKLIYLGFIFISGCLSACQEDNVGKVEIYPLNRYEFPQGNAPWDLEIKQIADDWGMYIIYKNVDSTQLNRRWTIPDYRGPIYVCEQPSDEQLREYLNIIKNGLLATLDKTRETDRKQLPVYFYLVNNFHDNNPSSSTYGEYVKIKQDGFDYWSLSFTDTEWEKGVDSKTTHRITCTFTYPVIKAALVSGEIKIPDEFLAVSDYESRIGTRYVSMEQFRQENPGAPPFYYEMIVPNYERSAENAYQHRGFAPQVTEDYELFTHYNGQPSYGAPVWMPWIKFSMMGMESDVNQDYLHSVPERQEQDFLNFIRFAMTYTEADILDKFPQEIISDPIAQKGNEMIMKKYRIVTDYIKSTLGLDLAKYAATLK